MIDRLSNRYHGPRFDPHMTLLGDIDGNLSAVEQKIKDLAKGLEKLELTLGPVSFSTTYFQSVFVRVNSNAKLMQLNLEAKKLFDMENNVFMLHISLLYGDHDMATREKAAASVDLPSSSFIADKLLLPRFLLTIPRIEKLLQIFLLANSRSRLLDGDAAFLYI